MRPHLCAHAASLDTGKYTHATLLGLGRGISEKGELSTNGKLRVTMTLNVARALRQRGIKVKIIWTGFKNLQQVRDNVTIGDAGSEGAAMLECALSQYKEGDETIRQIAETESTSSVGNMAYCAADVPENSLIIPVSDDLHFMYGRIEFAVQLMFPRRDYRLVSMPFKYSRKEQLGQLASAVVTRLGMTGVKRGNKDAVLKRQAQLERATEQLRRLLGR